MKTFLFLYILMAVFPVWAHFTEACNIFDDEGNLLRRFPGNFCIFLADGSFITASDRSLRRLSVSQEVLWEIPGLYHHQLNLSVNRDKILALSSEVKESAGKKNRTDVFLVADLNGKILASQSAEVLLKLSGVAPLNLPLENSMGALTGADSESSHFNSFYEAPDANAFLVNSSFLGYFVLSSDLSRVLRHGKIETSQGHRIHDLQMTKRGTYIYFNNLRIDSVNRGFASSIEEWDPKTQKLTFLFKANPEPMFYSQYCGSVQELGTDEVLFTDNANGTYIYSRKKRKLVKTLRGLHTFPEGPRRIQQAKQSDLSEFLKRHTPK